MSFIFPQALLSLLLVPLLAVAYLLMQRRRRRYALRYSSVALVREAVGKGPGIRRHIPPALFLLALAALAVTLARPQLAEPLEEGRGTVILSVDVSGSMQATDVEPNRMEATKDALRAFVRAQPKSVEVGLVSFSDNASILQAPTKDKDRVLRAIDGLQPLRGTNIGAGLQAAVAAIEQAAERAATPSGGAASRAQATATPTASTPSASVVLISDGESNTGPPPLRAAQEAASAGVRVYTVGIGTPEGIELLVRGQRVWTRLDEATLRGMAEAAGGRYLSAQDEGQLMQVYDELAQEQRVEAEEQEITFVGVALGMALSVLGGLFSLLWFNRLP